MKRVVCAGILVTDLIAVDLPRVSRPGEITFAPRGIGMHIGGHAANVSVDLMGLGMGLDEVSCLGAVGDDLFGNFIEQTLFRRGVSVRLQVTRDARTSMDLILVVKGQDRRYHADVGANSSLDPSFVLRSIQKERPRLFYVGGAGLLGKFDTHLARVLKEAQDYGSMTFVDPVMPYQKSWAHLRKAMKWIDFFHCNDTEAESLTREMRLEIAIKALASFGPQIVVVSRGRKGVLAATRDRLISMEAYRVRTLDPTGAGDAFCAGIIYKLTQGPQASASRNLDLREAELAGILLEAQAAGAACVMGIGTTSAVTRKNVDGLLAAQGTRVLRSMVIKSI
jgi:fructokinase